jgi:Family of unknown function (DUF6544)
MAKILLISFIVFLIIHGLIHLMGFIAYWPLGKISELPYKTTLLGNRWEIGSNGMRIYSLFWLLAVLGFIVSCLGLVFNRSWWAPVLLATVLLSLVICIFDWKAAFRGAWIDVVLLMILFVVFGLRVTPTPLAAFSVTGSTVETVPLPENLPTPVERYYRLVYGERIPIVHSAVISGRGTVRLMGITFPARIRFSHISGKDYHHYIEPTFFGFPILKVNEWYVDGHNKLELPFKVFENDPGVDSAANQGLWSETLAYPAFLLTDSRVHWEAMDETHASLHVPYGDAEQVFTIQFDLQTGELVRYETVRYHDAKTGNLRWWGDINWTSGKNGKRPNQVISAVWEDEGTPWMIIEVEETAFNADLSSYIQQKGP